MVMQVTVNHPPTARLVRSRDTPPSYTDNNMKDRTEKTIIDIEFVGILYTKREIEDQLQLYKRASLLVYEKYMTGKFVNVVV